MTIRRKLFATFLSMCLLTAATGIFAIKSYNYIEDSTEREEEVGLEEKELAILKNLKDGFLTFKDEWLEHIRMAGSHDPAMFRKENEEVFLPAIYSFASTVND
jgi:hypothetical protein